MNTFTINTLHRGKYILGILALLFLAGILISYLPIKEWFKIIALLFTLPIIFYIAIHFSMKPSTWEVMEDAITIKFPDKSLDLPLADIDHIRSLTRSGGNLYVIYLKKKNALRFWRNKLFATVDDQEALHQALLQHHKIVFIKL